MTPEQLSRLETLFDEACRLPERRRREFAEEKCATDTTVRVSLLALLEADRTRATPLDQPVLTSENVAAAISAEPRIPPNIGKYRLIRQLGEGGMGIVYEAEQENPRRRVAVKLMRPASANADAIRRFQREAELLARLHHTGIAQVFEAGVTQVELRNAASGAPLSTDVQVAGLSHETSLPYLVMEYIDGQTLLRYCETRRLSERERVALMIKVCDAVQHAHQRGIIHRDLKPGNILVVEQSDGASTWESAKGATSRATKIRAIPPPISPQPKILDFGVARVLELDPVRTARTLTGQIVGTLPYMSPEQFAGDADVIDTRSDVYALGVILYELLCGRLPHAATHPLELARKIREDDPPRPSSIRPTVRGDLETIILKTLQKEPDRRYQTAAELRDDLSRFLLNEPIEARRTSGLYILRKTLIRYRFAALMLAGFVLLTTVSSISLGVLYRRAEREKRAADVRTEALRRSNYFNTVALAQANLRDGNSANARRMLTECPDDLRDWEWHYLWSECDTSLHTIHAHEGTHALQFAPNDLRLATIGYDRALRIWDPFTNKPLLEYGTSSMAETVAFSPDGRRCAVATRFPYVQVFSLDAPAAPVRLAPHESNVWANRVAWSPRGELLATAAQSRDVQLFNGTTLERVDAIQSGRRVSALAFSPTGDTLAFGAPSGNVELWTTAQPREIREWVAHSDAITAIAFTPDGRRVVTRGSDNQIRVWNPADGSLVFAIPCSNTGVFFAISPDGSRVAAGVDLTVREWSLETGEQIAEHAGHGTQIIGISYSYDGRWLASGDRDGMVRIWRADRDTSPRVLPNSGRVVLSASIDEKMQLLWSASNDGLLIARTMPDGNELYRMRPNRGEAIRAALAPNGEFGIVAGEDGAINVLHAITGAPMAHLHTEGTRVRCVTISRDSRRAAVASESGRIRIYDLTSLRLARAFVACEEIAYSCEFLPDNQTLALCGGDGSVSLWDSQTGRMIRRLGAHDNRAYAIATSPDGNLIASGGLDRAIRLWSVKGGAPLRVIQGHADAVRSLRFSKSGRRLLSGGNGELIYLWDVETGSQVLALNAHARSVESIVTSEDGRFIVSGGADSTVKIWDSVANGAITTAQR